VQTLGRRGTLLRTAVTALLLGGCALPGRVDDAEPAPASAESDAAGAATDPEPASAATDPGGATGQHGDAPILRAVLISDLNAPYGSTHYPAEVGHAVRYITNVWRPDVVLIAGDMVAGQAPALTDSVVRAMWAAFDAVVAAPIRAAGIPLIATMGNHDASAYPAHARDRRLAAEYWNDSPHRSGLRTHDAPERSGSSAVVDDAHYPMRYVVQLSDVLIVSWDATRQESATSEELVGWLQRALTSTAAAEARHRVVLSHLPMYGVAEGRDRPGEVLLRGDDLRRQIESWGGTLFVSGHHHAYYPGRRDAIELLHSGALGEGPRVLLGTGMPPTKTLSLLDFHADSLAITTYRIDAAGTLEPVALSELPSVICGDHGWVSRRDLIGTADPQCPARN
jgi:hypothetical protein